MAWAVALLLAVLPVEPAAAASTVGSIEALIHAGVERAATGDLDGAIAAYDTALRLRPNFAEALFNRGNAYRQRLQRARRLAEPQGSSGPSDEARALADYDSALTLRPDFAAAYVNRAILWYERGDYSRAIADCDTAIRLQPKLAEAWNNRSLAWYRSGHYDKAKADFDQTIRLEQFYGNAMIMRAVPDITAGSRPR